MLTGVTIHDSAQKRLAECRELINEKPELFSTLRNSIAVLQRIGNAILYYDFAPYSFMFEADGFRGGLIYHEGTGWMLHT